LKLVVCAAIAAGLSLILWNVSLCRAQEQNEQAPEVAATDDGGPGDDVEAIRAGSQWFVKAFNKGDAKAVAAYWTETGDLVDEAGRVFSGRKEIADAYSSLFKSAPKTKLHVVIDSIRLLSQEAAIEEGRAMLDPAPAGSPATSKYLAVHVKIDGKWLMSTVRESRLELPSTFHHVSDLEWLIGTWVAEEHGAKTVSICRWIANKSFVERSFTVTKADGTETTGLQLIGWNPLEDHVQSWTFSSGGHAVGVWTAREDGWQAEIGGVTGDGVPTTATNTLRKLDDDAYVWQSTQRTVAGQSIADTEEIVLERQANK
jgi:uncharacterized protein (TIGR02246 family)